MGMYLARTPQACWDWLQFSWIGWCVYPALALHFGRYFICYLAKPVSVDALLAEMARVVEEADAVSSRA